MVIINIFPEKEERKKAIISYKYKRVPWRLFITFLTLILNRLRRRRNWKGQIYYTAHTIFHDKYAGKDFFTDKNYVIKSPLKIIRIKRGATSLIWFLFEYHRIIFLKHILLLEIIGKFINITRYVFDTLQLIISF